MTESSQITHFRRYQNYDYSRGAVEFITFHLEKRIPIFGYVSPDGVMHLSRAGEILEEVLHFEEKRAEYVDLMRYQIMPEHLHLRLYIHPNAPQPLKQQGQFISNIKRWSCIKCADIGIHFTWQANFHDRLCLSREIIERVDEYISLNPMKWALMHGENPPMKVFEPLYSPLLPLDEWWSGVGNLQWISGDYPLFSIRLSRKLRLDSATTIIPNIIAECYYKRLIPISTFISPVEKMLFQQLCQTEIPMICVVPDTLKTIHHPRVEHTPLFSQNRLLLLSHAMKVTSRQESWLNLNEKIKQIALVSNGQWTYLR